MLPFNLLLQRPNTLEVLFPVWSDRMDATELALLSRPGPRTVSLREDDE